MSVWLWGRPGEAVIDAVGSALAAGRTEFLVADTPDIATFDPGRGLLSAASGGEIDVDAISGVLVRPEATCADPGIYASLAAWTESADATVLNRLSAGASNLSKPYQLRLIAASGFDVPDTLITTDPDDARAFWAEHGRVIYKSTGGVRSIASLLAPRHETRLPDVAHCPTLFQQYIAGIDHRVHVVGDDLFACRIESDATDYRYARQAGHAVALHPACLPADIATRCLQLSDALGLELAGIDLRLDAAGHWWCFEVNTAPGFVWFEAHTAQPIAAAVASLLSPRRNPGPYREPSHNARSPHMARLRALSAKPSARRSR